MRPPSTSLARILDVLLTFGERPRGLSVQDVARMFGISRSSTYRYLQLLRSRGLVEETSRPGRFRVGPAVAALAQVRAAQRNLGEIAEPTMRKLGRATGESVLLTRRTGERATVIVSIDSPQIVRVRIEAARNSLLHVGSFGKLHMAYLADDELAAFLAKSLYAATTGEPIDAGALRREVSRIRSQGYAVSDSEVEFGMRSVSAPVLLGESEMVAALTVAGPTFRLTQHSEQRLVRQVKEAAAAIAKAWQADSGTSPEFGVDREAV